MRLILASASPRRAELLASAGFTFTVQSAEIDETPFAGEPPDVYVTRLARAKAQAVGVQCRNSGTVVLAADTAVVHDGKILGKPVDRHDALRMVKTLAGVVHDVFTGVAVTTDRQELVEVVRTRVHLLPITLDEIRWYVETGEPEGKAGGYAIQGHAARFVDWIDGSWSNVVGLPIATVYQLLKKVS